MSKVTWGVEQFTKRERLTQLRQAKLATSRKTWSVQQNKATFKIETETSKQRAYSESRC